MPIDNFDVAPDAPVAHDRVDSAATYAASAAGERLFQDSQTSNLPLLKPETFSSSTVIPRLELFDSAPGAPPNVVEGTQTNTFDKSSLQILRELRDQSGKDDIKPRVEGGAKDTAKKNEQEPNADRESNVDKEALKQAILKLLKEGEFPLLRIDNFLRNNFGSDSVQKK